MSTEVGISATDHRVALRRAAAAAPAVEIRVGVKVTGWVTTENGAPRAACLTVDEGNPVRGEIVVDALAR